MLARAVGRAVLHQFLERTLPGMLGGTGSPGLGWSLGGSVGVGLGAPGRRVVAVVGARGSGARPTWPRSPARD